VNETAYFSSLHEFVKSMENSAIESINRFVDDLAKPSQTLLRSKIQAFESDSEETGPIITDLCEHLESIQDQLEYNAQLLFMWQILHNNRPYGKPSEFEIKLASQLCESLSYFSSRIPSYLLETGNNLVFQHG